MLSSKATTFVMKGTPKDYIAVWSSNVTTLVTKGTPKDLVDMWIQYCYYYFCNEGNTDRLYRNVVQ
jgi:hypothetical protein